MSLMDFCLKTPSFGTVAENLLTIERTFLFIIVENMLNTLALHSWLLALFGQIVRAQGYVSLPELIVDVEVKLQSLSGASQSCPRNRRLKMGEGPLPAQDAVCPIMVGLDRAGNVMSSGRWKGAEELRIPKE